MIPFMGMSRISRSIETESRLVVAKAEEEMGGGEY